MSNVCRDVTFTKKQQSVIDDAKMRLKKFAWFKGVCTDSIPADVALEHPHQITAAVDALVADTIYFDGPGPSLA